MKTIFVSRRKQMSLYLLNKDMDFVSFPSSSLSMSVRRPTEITGQHSRMKCFIALLILVDGVHCECLQAWNGGGTGAWYRLDTDCRQAFVATNLTCSLPQIVPPRNGSANNDGFYVSLGVFNRFNGVALDVGLTFDWKRSRWYSYGNDASGWKSGTIQIDSRRFPSVNISLRMQPDSIVYAIRTLNDSMLVGEDVYSPSQLDPLLNFTRETFDRCFGFYRFESIAQSNETLKSGSQLVHARTSSWTLLNKDGQTFSADRSTIAASVRGFPAGACCTEQEVETIDVHEETEWSDADLSIRYL